MLPNNVLLSYVPSETEEKMKKVLLSPFQTAVLGNRSPLVKVSTLLSLFDLCSHSAIQRRACTENGQGIVCVQGML